VRHICANAMSRAYKTHPSPIFVTTLHQRV